MTDTPPLSAELKAARDEYEQKEAAATAARERLYDVIRRAAQSPADGGLGPSEAARQSGFTREHVANIRDGKTSRPARRAARRSGEAS